EATRFGALDFLEKPVALARLLTAVKAGLERGRLIRSLAAAGVSPPRFAAPAGPAGAPGAAMRPPPTLGGMPVIAAPAAAVTVPPGVARTTGTGAGASAIQPGAEDSGVSLDQPLREARDQFERVYFEYHLAKENFSMTRVADRAGLERTHLYRKLKQLGVELGRGGRRAPVVDALNDFSAGAERRAENDSL